LKIFGIIVIILGVAALLFADAVALDSEYHEHVNSAIAAAIVGWGIVAAGAILLHHSKQ
jgi:hypothetical protein